jgi:hypothetical protein
MELVITLPAIESLSIEALEKLGVRRLAPIFATLNPDNVIDIGRDSEGLDYMEVRNVVHVTKYSWGGPWKVEFTDGSNITIPSKDANGQRELDDFEYNASDGTLLMGWY